MEFTRRGPADADDGRRFPDPPPHGDAMVVTRDALLSQLQRDRLRQEIIVAELTKIELSMALRAGAASGHQAAPVPRHGMAVGDAWSEFGEEFIWPQRWGPVDRDHFSDVGKDHDEKPTNKDAMQTGSESRPGKSSMDDRSEECSRPSHRPSHRERKAARQKAAFDKQKLPESNERTVPPKKASPAVKWKLTGITIPVKKPKSRQIWNCVVCQVKATSERNLQEHYAGQQHRSNVATLESQTEATDQGQKAETTAEPSPGEAQKTSSVTKWSCRICQAICTSELDLKKHLGGERHREKMRELCEEGKNMARDFELQKAKMHPNDVPQHAEKILTWCCSICQARCTCELDLKKHLNGERHRAKIQALTEEGKNMAKNSELQKAKLNPNNVPQHEKKKASSWSCSICQAHCTCESDLQNHLKGWRHQLNIQALREEANQEKNIPPNLAKIQNPLWEWSCSLCQATCNSESQFVNHCMSRKHQQMLEALQGEEGKNSKAGSQKVVNETPSDEPNSKKPSSEKVEKQTELYLCKVCDVQCNSEKMLAHHRAGKKHAVKLGKLKELGFCGKKVLADHQNGVKHLENVAKQKAEQYFCEVCNLQCSNEKMLADHRYGKKHRAKLNGKK